MQEHAERHADDWVLVLADATERAAWLTLLEQQSYHTLMATHAAQALALLRRSSQALVVLLDVRHLHVLNAIIPDRRSARHHAYIVVGAPDDTCSAPVGMPLAQLSLQMLSYPFSSQALLEAVSRASKRFPAQRLYAAPRSAGRQVDALVTRP